jgi:DNA excision repair protein ERCC-4
MTPQDMLRSMPGITSANYRHVMNNVNNLNELVHMSKKQMTDLIGTELGNKLYRFINKKP